MTSPILENADLMNFLLKKVIDKNVVNVIVDMSKVYDKFIVGGEYPITECGGLKKINRHQNIIIVKKTKKMISYKLAKRDCTCVKHGGADVPCYEKYNKDEIDLRMDPRCGACIDFAADETWRKKIYVNEKGVEFIRPDIWRLKNYFDVYANNLVKC